MRKLAWVVVAIVLVAVAAWFVLSMQYHAGPEPASTVSRIGVVLPLSGDAAEWGTTMKRGIDLALEKINEDRADHPKVELLYEDDRGLPADGARATEKPITVNRVKGLIALGTALWRW